MSVTVKNIDIYGIKDRLKKADDKETLQLIKALEEALKNQQEYSRHLESKLKERT